MKRKIQDIEVSGKRVLLRCDFNVPVKDGKILDNSKIIASLETIEYLVKNKAKVIILSHFGKVKTEEDKLKNSLQIVAEELQRLVDTKVIFSKQTRSLYLEGKINSMNNGEILVLENTRYEDVPGKLESGNDIQLAMYWASLGDLYCLDAFGSAHRNHASTSGLAKQLPSCIGFLVQHELEALNKYVLNSEKPFTIVMGGAKVDDKVDLIEALLPKCDNLLISGGIANTCLNILGFNVGKSLKSSDEKILSRMKNILVNNKDKIMLPNDVIVTQVYNDEVVEQRDINEINDEDIIYDIGGKTIKEFERIINSSKTIFVNGTCGKYEDIRFANGTREVLDIIANSEAKTIVGGGDGVSAVKHFNLGDKFDFLSTGGGATLEYIINESLPAIEAIKNE